MCVDCPGLVGWVERGSESRNMQSAGAAGMMLRLVLSIALGNEGHVDGESAVRG